LACAGAH